MDLLGRKVGLSLGHEPRSVGRLQVNELVEFADVEVLVAHDALIHHVDPELKEPTDYSLPCYMCQAKSHFADGLAVGRGKTLQRTPLYNKGNYDT